MSDETRSDVLMVIDEVVVALSPAEEGHVRELLQGLLEAKLAVLISRARSLDLAADWVMKEIAGRMYFVRSLPVVAEDVQ